MRTAELVTGLTDNGLVASLMDQKGQSWRLEEAALAELNQPAPAVWASGYAASRMDAAEGGLARWERMQANFLPAGPPEEDERLCRWLTTQAGREKGDWLVRTELDAILEFCDSLAVPAFVSDLDSHRGLYCNPVYEQGVNQGVSTAGRRMEEIYIQPVADLLNASCQAVKEAGRIVVTDERLGQEHWQTLRIPFADQRGRGLVLGFGRMVRTAGIGTSWMLKRAPS